MTKVVVDDVDEVICVVEGLICKYAEMVEMFRKNGQSEMVVSTNGSIVGLVRLLSIITDKGTIDWFKELGIWEDTG